MYNTAEKRNAYQRKWYERNRGKILIAQKLNPNKASAYQRKRSQELRELITKIKHQPCADCGGWFNPWQMDFDHKPGFEKIECVSILARHGSIARSKIYKEIAKCDVVCANCHRERTHKSHWLKQLGAN